MYNNTQKVQNEDNCETLGETAKKILILANETKGLASSINDFMFKGVRESECERTEPNCFEDIMLEINDTLVSAQWELNEIYHRLIG